MGMVPKAHVQRQAPMTISCLEQIALKKKLGDKTNYKVARLHKLLGLRIGPEKLAHFINDYRLYVFIVSNSLCVISGASLVQIKRHMRIKNVERNMYPYAASTFKVECL